MATSQAQLKSQAKYDKTHRDNYKYINLKINKQTEQDIIKMLESVDNINGYIKDLIRRDIM